MASIPDILDGMPLSYTEYLGATADQAHASPFINPVEQGLPDITAVCEHVQSAKYAPLYALAYFPEEDALDPDGVAEKQLYTDNRYHNIGTPRNREIPGNPEPDVGLGRIDPTDPDLQGFYRTPTMRNVDKRRGKGFKKAYTHNGWFKSLESIVHFYNTRDTKNNTCEDLGIVQATETEALANDCWPAAEFPDTQAGIIGDLGLSADDEAALVAYLKTLTDIPTAKAPEPFSQKKFDNGELR